MSVLRGGFIGTISDDTRYGQDATTYPTRPDNTVLIRGSTYLYFPNNDRYWERLEMSHGRTH